MKKNYKYASVDSESLEVTQALRIATTALARNKQITRVRKEQLLSVCTFCVRYWRVLDKSNISSNSGMNTPLIHVIPI